MNMFKFLAVSLLSVAAGFLLGAAAIHRTIPDTAPQLPPARNPWNPKDLMGLIGSIGIRNLAGHLEALPNVVLETDRIFVLEIPEAGKKIHYVIIPKKDIRDIGEISAKDEPYLTEVFMAARQLIKERDLYNYQLLTNGPGRQKVAYLHFHLVGKRRSVH